MPPMFNTYNNAQQTPLVHHPQEPGLGNPPSRGHIQSLNSSTRHPDVAAILPTGYGLPKPSVDPRSLSNKGTSSPSNASTPPQRGVLSVGYEESATILPPGYRHTVQTSKITNPLARPHLTHHPMLLKLIHLGTQGRLKTVPSRKILELLSL